MATPWSLYERPAAEARFNDPAPARDEPVPVAAPPALRKMRINKSDLETYSYTAGTHRPMARQDREAATPLRAATVSSRP